MSLLLTRVPKMFCWRVLLSSVVVGASGFSCRSVDISVSGLLSLNRDKGKLRGKTEASRGRSEEEGGISELSMEFKEGSMKSCARSTEELTGRREGYVSSGKLDMCSPRMAEGSVEEMILSTEDAGVAEGGAVERVGVDTEGRERRFVG